MPTIFDVANYFLAKSDPEADVYITPLKLQKLTYYTKAWSLAIHNDPLFDSHFEAWVHGPVNPDLSYRKFKHIKML